MELLLPGELEQLLPILHGGGGAAPLLPGVEALGEGGDTAGSGGPEVMDRNDDDSSYGDYH